MPKFSGGVSINEHSAHRNGHSKMKHLRIKAGPQRDRYVHHLVFQAIIFGRREAYMRENHLINDLAVPDSDFYRYLDFTYETVDHDDQNSLNNDPGNLKRMRRGANTAKGNRHRTAKQREKKSPVSTNNP